MLKSVADRESYNETYSRKQLKWVRKAEIRYENPVLVRKVGRTQTDQTFVLPAKYVRISTKTTYMYVMYTVVRIYHRRLELVNMVSCWYAH